MFENYKTIIGLEIHAELLTSSKLFCSCSANADISMPPNTNICPVCTGQPGVLPRLNGGAFGLAIKASEIFKFEINKFSSFDRKNYYYPDTPKSYQITQKNRPIAINGFFKLSSGKIVQVQQMHIEEDAGKMFHDRCENKTLIDFNRSGIGLIEIVTKPDFRSSKEVIEFISSVTDDLRYMQVSTARMDEGTIRVDINVSIYDTSKKTLGEKVEIKNLNSLKSIEKAIYFEKKRQQKLAKEGNRVVSETRRYDEKREITVSLRVKETLSDYRYFQEPDVLSVYISEEEIEEIKSYIPVMPRDRLVLYTSNYKLAKNDAQTIVSNKLISDFFDEVVKIYPHFISVANFLVNELLRRFKEYGQITIPFPPAFFAKLIEMIDSGIISRLNAKEILKIMFETGLDPMEIAIKMGFLSAKKEEAVVSTIDEILKTNPDLVKDYKNGKTNILGFFMKKAVEELKNTDPKSIRKQLENKLKNK